jgi:hypothetical protein
VLRYWFEGAVGKGKAVGGGTQTVEEMFLKRPRIKKRGMAQSIVSRMR